jgi:hypothetical protein
MERSEILNFLRTQIEPLPDGIYGDRYRVAARLRDGTFLPCVVFQSKRKQVQLALRRFEDLRKEHTQYVQVVESFVASRTSVADYEIDGIEISPFAWPLSTLKKIHGETTMGWTAFVAEMNDGSYFNYGTSFRSEFFDLPNGYKHENIDRIHSGVVYLDSDGLQPFSIARAAAVRCLRKKTFFTCYLEDIDDNDTTASSIGSQTPLSWWTRLTGATKR